MRILLVSASYPPVLGGLQIMVQSLAGQFQQRGHKVAVVTNRYPRSLPVKEVIDGVPVHRWLFLRPTFDHLVRGRADVFAASFYFHPASMLRLRRLLRQFEPDVVNIHFPESQISTVLWARRSFPFPLVASLHGDDVERWTSSESHRASDGGRRRLRSLLRAADAITTCSQYLREKAAEIEGATVRKSHVIPNGIAVERFEDLSSYTHPQSYILAYGRLVHKKGFDL